MGTRAGQYGCTSRSVWAHERVSMGARAGNMALHEQAYIGKGITSHSGPRL